MKLFLKILPIIFCAILMAAHLMRIGYLLLQIISLLIPFLLLWKNKTAVIIIQVFLILSGFEWIRTLLFYVLLRIENGQDWIRLALIIGTVALINFASLLVFRSKLMKERYQYQKLF